MDVDEIGLSLAAFPFAVTAIPARVDVEALDRYFARFEAEVLSRGLAYASIVDLSRLRRIPDGRVRVRTAEWSRAHEARRKNLAAVGVLTPNPIARATMRSIFWIFPPVVPMDYSATVADAVRFCAAHLEERASLTVDVASAIERIDAFVASARER